MKKQTNKCISYTINGQGQPQKHYNQTQVNKRSDSSGVCCIEKGQHNPDHLLLSNQTVS